MVVADLWYLVIISLFVHSLLMIHNQDIFLGLI